MDILKNGCGWVQFRFSDGTSRVIYTTLSPDILAGRGVSLKPGYLYDFRHEEYVGIREDAEEVRVFSDRPAAEGGAAGFAGRFI